MRLRIRQLIAGGPVPPARQYYDAAQWRRYRSLRNQTDRTCPRMPQPDPWSLAEICRVVGLSLSPESSLDPRRWQRYLLPWDGWFHDRDSRIR
jgi:hypothetical protein